MVAAGIVFLTLLRNEKNAKIPSGIPDELHVAVSMPSRSIVKNCKQLFLMIENFTV